jgi:uncharacterized delta-60 repeat protein
MVRVPGRRFIRLIALLLPLLAATVASAAPGDLDPTFDPGGPMPGVVTLDVSGAGLDDLPSAVVVLPSGRIVVAASNAECVLLGLTPAGALDSGFGTGGKVVLSQCANALALQPDGVGGTRFLAVSSGEVRRFSANGTLDATFGSAGVATSQAAARAVVVQSDRKIVLVTSSSDTAVALGRLLPDGGPDTGFGPSPGGIATHDFGIHVGVVAEAVQADGAIVIGGRWFDDANAVQFRSPMQFFVARFTSLGALDTGFKSPDGFVLTDFDGEQLRPLAVPALDPANQFAVLQSGVTGLVLQSGKIVAVGATQANVDDGDPLNPGASLGSHRDFVLMARYNSDGTLDTSSPQFGNTTPSPDGRAYGPLGDAAGVAVQTDGKIVANDFFGDPALFGVARFSPDGVLDPTFGTGGVVRTNFWGGTAANVFANALAVAIQPDGKIVAVGFADQDPDNPPENWDTRVVRYLGDDTTPPHISSASVNPSILWPPNRKMVPVAVTVAATDDVGPVSCSITAISSNEPVNGPGNKAPDWLITGSLTAQLRAERSGGGTGRLYTLALECQDGAENVATASVAVTVPDNR